VICRGSAGACDLAETCNNSVTACPADGRVGAGVICRGSVGACDLAETCNNSATACPADGRVGAGVICRSSSGACDLAETCNNSATACPADGRVGAGVICRSSVGACDLAETCNNSATVCPADARVGAGVSCRGSAGVCDLVETCNGTATVCPTDSFASGTVCRGSTSIPACDPVETCNGAMAACPSDVVTRPPTTEVCNAVDDNCNGTTDEPFTGTATSCTQLRNLSQGRTATQSSIYDACSLAARAFDGSTAAVHGPCPNSNIAIVNNQFDGWIQVDLADTYLVNYVSLWGRTDCCGSQSSDLDVRVSLDGVTWTNFSLAGQALSPSNVTVNRAARYVRVQRRAGISDYLTLGEIQVFGCPSPLGTSCTVGVGACARTGTNICSGDQLNTTCSVSPAAPTAEICNGADENCNGVIDDGNPGGGLACSTGQSGVCAAGTTACTSGAIVCNRNVGPSAEVCDGLDNDCDGVVDNGPSTTCGAAIGLGTINMGGVVTRTTDWIAGPAGSEQWYSVTFPQNADYASHGTGTPTIQLTAGASVRFDVQSAACGPNMPCGSGGSSTGLTSWSFADNLTLGAGGYTTRNTAWPTTVYIRVYRISATTTCTAQTLTVSRPASLAYYSGNFTGGVAPFGTAPCATWNTFRASMSPAVTYQTVRINGNLNAGGRQCNGANANALCQALRGGYNESVICNGTNWVVNECGTGNWEISSNGNGCDCNAPYVVRSCHGDLNFGGVNGAWSCGQASQSMGVSCDPSPTFSGNFTGGVTPNGTQVCTDWNAFRSTISSGVTYSLVTLSGSNNSTGFTCTGAAANTLCQALRAGTNTGLINCNGRNWSVGNCGGGMEISADGGLCTCGSLNVARPCHPNPDFGGMAGGSSCGQASQTLQVNCQ
jgi:hypothetical protein